MNQKNRVKFLKLRQRADRLELDALLAVEGHDSACELLAQRAEQAEKELADYLAKNTRSAQRIARLETSYARALEALESLYPTEGRTFADWKATIENTDLWSQQRAKMAKPSVTGGAGATVAYGAGGVGGSGGPQ